MSGPGASDFRSLRGEEDSECQSGFGLGVSGFDFNYKVDSITRGTNQGLESGPSGSSPSSGC